MKLKIIALALVVLILCLPLVSCGGELSGTYICALHDEGAEPTRYTFSGENVTYELFSPNGASIKIKGSYKISDGKIALDYGEENSFYNATRTFSVSDDFILIDGVKYIKN